MLASPTHREQSTPDLSLRITPAWATHRGTETIMAGSNDTLPDQAPVVVLMCGSDCGSDAEFPAVRKSIRQGAEC